VLSLSEDLKWIKGHLILLALVGTLVFGGVYGVESLIARHDDVAATRAAILADEQAKANQVFQAQVQQQISTLVQQNVLLEAQNQTLIAALSKRQVIEQQIPIKNQNISAVEAAKQLGGTSDGNNIVLDLPVARNVVSMVQLVPLLQQDKVDLTKANGLLISEVANAQQALDLERTAHTKDNTTNEGTIKARDERISALQEDMRKSKLKWFGIGYVAGFVSAIGLHAAGY